MRSSPAGPGRGPGDGDRASEAPAAERHPRLVLWVVGLGTLLTTLFASAINLALPFISAEFGQPIDRAGWVLSAFLLAVTVLLLVAGRAGDLYGYRRVYLAGFSLLAGAALACGLCGSLWQLILCRGLQGVGGALVMASGPALLTTSFPGRQRGRALGMLATATYAGLTAGPPLGGLVITALGWRALFWLSAPVSALIVLTGVRYLPAQPRRGPSTAGAA